MNNDRPYFRVYQVPLRRQMTILDSLHYIYENIDPNVAYRGGCRYGCCGSCMVKVNGHPRLICEENFQREIRIEPLDHYPVLKDLIISKDLYYRRINRAHPFLDHPSFKGGENPEILSPADFEIFKQASRCIACLGCDSECPLGIMDFPGPAFFVQMGRFLFDPRDERNRSSLRSKAKKCLECGKCETACPKEIPIVRIIGEIKRV
jgi:succinate dehydrogenase/fumarate reductase iron-sulfur protein